MNHRKPLWLLLLLLVPLTAWGQDPVSGGKSMFPSADQLRTLPSLNAMGASGFGSAAILGQMPNGSSPSTQMPVAEGKEGHAELKEATNPPSPPPKSRAEEFFASPEPSVGEAVGGAAVNSQDLTVLSPSDAAMDQLLFPENELTPLRKIQLFRQLTPSQQRDYLQQLPVTERDVYLKALGQEGVWDSRDLVQDKVDRDLGQFGYSFFQGGEEGFSAEKFAPVGPDYIIGPGDTLVVDVWGNIEANYKGTVDRSGNLVLPKVGSVHLWGQSFAEAKETIRQQIAKYYTHFELNVSMDALRSIQVYLVGEVAKPGTYTVSSLSTILNALAAAGGPAKTGSLRKIQLVRNGETVSTMDFYDFFIGGDRSRDARLQSGDTILVPVVGPLVGVAGAVRRPAIYELKEGESLADVLKMAGGALSTAYLKRIQVERIDPSRGRKVMDVDFSPGTGVGGGSIVLQDRDLIKIASISPASDRYVLLKGYVSRPGRYQFTEGMRVRDILQPYDNLLPSYYGKMAEVLRIEPPDYRPEKITFDLQRAIDGDLTQNLRLKEFDEVRIFARQEMEEVPVVQVTGAVLNPGSFRLYDRMTVKDLIASAGNLKRSAYLTQAEITRYIPAGTETRTERILIDLNKALQGDMTNNVALQEDDHLFVRSIPDFGERLTVAFKGEVLFPGTYAIAKGETLGSVLARAGGFTDRAYLRGAVFTRDSLKDVQRQRVQKLLQEQEEEIDRLSSEMAQGALSDEDMKAAQAVLASRKALVAKLKQAPVTGRMVVHLSSLDKFRGSAADFELTAGDTLTVPENPQSVTVLGQVYNPTSLTYRQGRPVAFYLDQVGGATKNADKDEMFIVRADGTVVSNQQSGFGLRWDKDNHRWLMGGFQTTEIYPGDAILVPEEIKKMDWLKETKDITTIIYQMALGAAAVMAF